MNRLLFETHCFGPVGRYWRTKRVLFLATFRRATGETGGFGCTFFLSNIFVSCFVFFFLCDVIFSGFPVENIGGTHVAAGNQSTAQVLSCAVFVYIMLQRTIN